MKVKIIVATIFSAVAMAISAVIAPISASADYPTVDRFGARQELVDAAGAMVTGWTVTNLRPSDDVVTFPVRGHLWEATTTVEAVRGAVVPVVSDFNARAANGESYRALFNVPSDQAVNPTPIAQGMQESGKLYFDVVGPEPNSVVYNNGIQDVLIWTA